jgi:hypothetical protein
MQTLTFTPKLLRQRRFLSFLLPLFAIFVGVASSFTVQAQSTINFRRVFVTSGTSNSTATTNTYDAVSTAPGPGVFQGTNFGSFDLGTGVLLLQGGSIEIVEAPNENYPTAQVNYGVRQGTLASTGGTNIPALTNSVQLTQTNYDAATRTRTFSLSTAAINILRLATAGGAAPGTTYRFDISVSTGNGEDDNGDVIAPILGQRRISQFTATGNPFVAPTVAGNTIIVSPNGAGNVTYYLPNPPNASSTPQFPGANLSASANGGTSYDVNTGRLLLNNVTVTTTESSASTVDNVILYYRTRLSTNPGGAFQAIPLTQSGNVVGGTRTFVIDPSTASQPNLIATPAVTAAGNYNVDIYFQANGRTNGANFSITDPPSGVAPYSATFIVTGTPIAQTIWTGAKNDNWFDADNWSNGIPDETKNTLVRDFGTGNAIPYPNIYSGVVVTTAGGAVLYDNTAYPFAATRNLILGGTSQANRSITRLVQGRLKVFGDFSNNFASFIQRENTVIEFAGTGSGNGQGANQVITGGSFVAVEVSGDGNKDLSGLMEVSQSITFLGGVLRTDITQPLLSLVILADRALINNNNGAQINGENDVTYLRGFIRTLRQGVLVGETRTYGNMGMTLTFTGANNPGNVEITRNTVEAYAPVSGKFGIRRIFGIRPSDQATNTGGLQATMVFRYRSSETVDLNGPNTFTPGSGMIPEDRLTIFFSDNGGGRFSLIGRDGPVDQINKTVTRTGVTKFATITLGDVDNPLPVTLTSLQAKRVGNDAQVAWETASEVGNKGFEVQVSTDGKEFRTLGFVASSSANSTTAKSYSFIDVEKNKTGNRYYRLRQLDVDGKDAFFGPRTVNFDGKAADAAASLLAYPNPFNSADEVHLTLESAYAGNGSITVTDMTGRIVRQQNVSLSTGNNNVTVERLNDLKAGVYMVRLAMPNGQAQSLKVLKQ